jgi:outer membrane protein, multidrug efflux system
MQKGLSALVLVFALSSATAFAQTAPAPGTPLAQAPPAPAATASSAAAIPPPPEVSDPMLSPVPPPKRVLSSWKEALYFLHGRSTNLKIALDQVLQAEAQTILALAQYLPWAGGCSGGSNPLGGCGNGSYSHQLLTNSVKNAQSTQQLPVSNTLPVPDTFTASVAMSQDIINVQEFDQISINELSEDASRLTVGDMKRTLELSLANQIVSVVTAERSAELNRVGLRVALVQLEITRRKAALGAATGLDEVRAKQNAANARAALVSGDEALREAREALGLALGVAEETGVAQDISVDGIADLAQTECRALKTVEDRPDIASARTNLEVAKRNLRNIWYSFLPAVTAQSQISGTSVPNVGYPNPTWSIGAVLSVPIWDGGTRYANIKNARAAEDIAGQNLESLRRQAIIQVEQAQRGIQVAAVADAVAREQRDLAAQNDQMTQAAYVRGQGTSVDLVVASEAHRQAELNLALAEFNMVKARLAAIMALAVCPW